MVVSEIDDLAEMDAFAVAQAERRLRIAARLLNRASRLNEPIRPRIGVLAALHLADEVVRIIDETDTERRHNNG